MGRLLNNMGSKKGVTFLIFLGWLVYSTSYLGKVNYSANITQIVEFYNITKTQAGTVPTFFFFSYGIGQVFNGIFCKKYNIKRMIFSSLFVSGSINLIIAVSSSFYIIKWLWMVNGFILSILWPTIIRMFSEVLPQKKLGVSSVVMGTTVPIGTLIVYGTSSIFALLNNFKLSFYLAGFSLVIVAFVWLLFYNVCVESSKKEMHAEKIGAEEKADANVSKPKEENKSKTLFVVVSILCFFAIGVNLIKDGLTTWVPSILKEEFGLSDALSILLTLFLPVLAVFGNACALGIHKKIPDYVNHCSTVFVVIAILIGIIIESLIFKVVSLMLIVLVAANFFASSLNSLLTGIFPLFMREKANSGLLAGVINGFCYVGSAISSYGLGAIADNFGWLSVFYTLGSFCLITVVIWLVYLCYKRFLVAK